MCSSEVVTAPMLSARSVAVTSIPTPFGGVFTRLSLDNKRVWRERAWNKTYVDLFLADD